MALPTQCAVGCQGLSLPACGQPHRQSTHRDTHSQCHGFAFKESILHIIIYKLKKSNKGHLLPLKRGEIIWHVITKGKNEAQSSLFPRMPQSHTFLPWLTHVPLSPVTQAARDYEVVITSTTEEASSIPKCRQRRQLSCLASRYTAQLSVRGLGL